MKKIYPELRKNVPVHIYMGTDSGQVNVSVRKCGVYIGMTVMQLLECV